MFKGIEIRVNRSIQVEGVFGIIKQNYGRTRFNRRGIKRVSTEAMLYFLGFNIAKLFNYYETGKQNKFWIASENLDSQTIKKISAKKLSKKEKNKTTILIEQNRFFNKLCLLVIIIKDKKGLIIS